MMIDPIVLILYVSSIVIHILAVLITTFFVLPLQIREARVKDSLSKLRIQLLIYASIIIVLGIISTAVLSLRFIVDPTNPIIRYIAISLVFLHSLGFLGFSIIGYMIWNQKYEDHGNKVMDHLSNPKEEKAK